MTDVRSLLRAEKALRSGSTLNAVKKRKANDDEESHDERKRAKPSSSDTTSKQAEPQEIESEIEEQVKSSSPEKATSPSIPNTTETSTTVPINEDEWAAFQREVASPKPIQPTLKPKVSYSTATIVAAPLSTAELEAQRKKGKLKEDRARREEDELAEKEELQNRTLEEFEEMEAWEERVKKLREERERLRGQNELEVAKTTNEPEFDDTRTGEIKENEEESDTDSDFDYDELEDLGFRR